VVKGLVFEEYDCVVLGSDADWVLSVGDVVVPQPCGFLGHCEGRQGRDFLAVVVTHFFGAHRNEALDNFWKQ